MEATLMQISAMRLLYVLALPFLTLISSQNPASATYAPNRLMLQKFAVFKQKIKFRKDASIGFPGLADESLLPLQTQNINPAAEDFQRIAQKGEHAEKEYLEVTSICLDRFRVSQLDTEERECVCNYFEELMDIVGLERSDGLLNEFMNGFNPK